MTQTDRRAEIERLWDAPESRKYLLGIPIIYSQPLDPRLIVPKKPASMGWTINFAHPQAVTALIALLFIAPLIILLTIGAIYVLGFSLIASVLVGVAAELIVIAAICLVCARKANQYLP